MFRDVAFGQYYPAKSFVHRMDPRVKILLNLLYMITIFLVQSYFGYALMLAYLLISIFASRIPLKSVLKSVKGIIFLALFTAIINLFFVKSGNVLVDWWIFRITDDGVNFAVKMVVRLVFLVTSASLLTLTTTPVDLTHGIESLLKPLTWIKVPVDEFALIMSITLRFIPTLMDETDRIIRAQKARGASFDTGGLIARAKAFVPILIPLLVNAFRREEELALAMNARCYEGARKRTKMKKLKFSWRDLAGTVFTVLFIGGVITLRYLPAELLESVKWMTF